LFSELSEVDDGTEHYKYIAYQFEKKKIEMLNKKTKLINKTDVVQ